MNISGFMVTIGTMGVLGGMAIMFNDPTNKIMGGIIVLLGLALCIGSYFKVAVDENKKRATDDNSSQNMERMVTGIETMSKNITTLVEEMRKDREKSVTSLEGE